MSEDRYAPDEFDTLPDDSPVGVHRRVPRIWTRAVTFVAILAAFAGLAFGAAKFWYALDDIPWLAWIRGAVDPAPSSEPFVTISVTPSVTPTPSASPSASVEPTYLLGASVTVYNAGGDQGAAAAATYLAENGDLAAVTSGTWSGIVPPASVVRYSRLDLEDTAQLIADVLGIRSIAFGPVDGREIAVVLVENPLEDAPQPSPSS